LEAVAMLDDELYTFASWLLPLGLAVLLGWWLYATLSPSSELRHAAANAMEALRKEQRAKVRIVHWSDTHNFLNNKTILPQGDIFIHSGDFTHHGKRKEFKKFNAWLESISDKFPFRVVVLGNHDTSEMKDIWRKRGGLQAMKLLLPAATHVLVHEVVEIFGINFWGSPWQWFQNARYESWYTLATAAPKFEQIPPEGVHVLITHGPAKGILDKNIGSPQLLAALEARRIPLHLFGHIHECRGVYTRPHGCLSVNSSACGEHTPAGIKNAPHVIEYDRASNTFRIAEN